MLTKVKKGDKICLSERGKKRISVVEDITPAGNIKVEGYLYNPKTGRLKSSDPYATNRIYAVN